MERLLVLSILAAAWPLWGPFLRCVLAEIRTAAESEPAPAARPVRREELRGRLVNTAWDDLHLSRRRRTFLARSDETGFRTPR